MNGDTTPRNHTRFVVTCVTILGGLCILGGFFLTWKGFNAELLIGGAVSAISGLLGMLSTRQQPTQPMPDITLSSPLPTAEINNNPPPTP